MIQVPYLDEDVHDLAGLAQINRYLFVSGRERATDRRGGSAQLTRARRLRSYSSSETSQSASSGTGKR